MSDRDEGGFTAADNAAIFAIEIGIPLAPWQFDVLAAALPVGGESDG